MPITPEPDYARQNKLQGKYKFLQTRGIQNDAMCFGFECGNGWLSTLEWLFAEIDKIDKPKDFHVDQVKQKFGGLRVYHSGADKDSYDKIDSLITQAEEKCKNTCEDCSTIEDLIWTKGYILRLCKNCADKEERTYE